ncbi:hypothetical protein O181_065823 [Austropuccinia psidii MF-1]|uniref:Uncharacterized protein n=1 Tax=Austropuccinia psidii MF-1 TaxID=1389203 RepID=A0A9Q3EW10_9BASI|nr:hypothetical protein [Austropuccinia psidii MF-1]
MCKRMVNDFIASNRATAVVISCFQVADFVDSPARNQDECYGQPWDVAPNPQRIQDWEWRTRCRRWGVASGHPAYRSERVALDVLTLASLSTTMPHTSQVRPAKALRQANQYQPQLGRFRTCNRQISKAPASGSSSVSIFGSWTALALPSHESQSNWNINHDMFIQENNPNRFTSLASPSCRKMHERLRQFLPSMISDDAPDDPTLELERVANLMRISVKKTYPDSWDLTTPGKVSRLFDRKSNAAVTACEDSNNAPHNLEFEPNNFILVQTQCKTPYELSIDRRGEGQTNRSQGVFESYSSKTIETSNRLISPSSFKESCRKFITAKQSSGTKSKKDALLRVDLCRTPSSTSSMSSSSVDQNTSTSSSGSTTSKKSQSRVIFHPPKQKKFFMPKALQSRDSSKSNPPGSKNECLESTRAFLLPMITLTPTDDEDEAYCTISPFNLDLLCPYSLDSPAHTKYLRVPTHPFKNTKKPLKRTHWPHPAGPWLRPYETKHLRRALPPASKIKDYKNWSKPNTLSWTWEDGCRLSHGNVVGWTDKFNQAMDQYRFYLRMKNFNVGGQGKYMKKMYPSIIQFPPPILHQHLNDPSHKDRQWPQIQSRSKRKPKHNATIYQMRALAQQGIYSQVTFDDHFMSRFPYDACDV